ncbi:MAG: HDOD domain-containing protein [Gammaproteobacteria bacterium]|nr:HDOD domain-containing protein [Gammaproteobacteria bacterium]
MSIYLDKLPLPNESNFLLIKACTEPDIEVEKFSRLVSANAIISARLLAMANSAYYGFEQSINSVEHAIVAIGFEAVQNIVLCFAIKESLEELEFENIDSYPFWRDSLYRAVATKHWYQKLAEYSEPQKSNTAINNTRTKNKPTLNPLSSAASFTAGLLGDIGLLTLFIMEPQKLDRWELLLSSTPDQRIKLEQDLFNTNHCNVGSELISHWGLPDIYSVAIFYHQSIDNNEHLQQIEPGIGEEKLLLARALLLADWTVALLHSFDKANALKRLKLLLSKLMVKQSKEAQSNSDFYDDILDDFLKELTAEVSQISEVMDLGKLSSIDFNELFHQANIKLAKDNLSYQELTWKLQSALKERDLLAEKLNLELTIAREIQKSLQSDITYRQHVAAINIPAKTLSGDFFDYYEHSNGEISFCLGDVSGKGTHAALVMAKTISLYRCLSKVERNLATVVNLINKEISETSVRGMFVTFVAGRIDLNKCSLELINAGHIPPLRIGSKSVDQIEPQGPPLGVLDDFDYEVHKSEFLQSRLYLYTDGITEAQTALGEELGTKAFIQWILQSKDLPLKQQLDWLRERFEKDIQNWADDLTLMMIASRC